MQVLGHMMARGEGSSLMRKNTRTICGKPIIYWALKNAIDSGFMDEIFVFTEDNEIAEVTESLACRVVKRPKEMLFYNGGFSMPSAWDEYFQTRIKKQVGSTGDITVNLNCNICLLLGETLRQMYIRLMEDELAETIFPVVEVEPHIYMVNPVTHYLFPIWEDPGLDRQKFPKLYRRIGISINHKKRSGQASCTRRLHHVISYEESLDIHSQEDIDLAEYYLGKRLAKENSQPVNR